MYKTATIVKQTDDNKQTENEKTELIIFGTRKHVSAKLHQRRWRHDRGQKACVEHPGRNKDELTRKSSTEINSSSDSYELFENVLRLWRLRYQSTPA